MIKEKTVYHSTVTGKEYTSLEEALRAEKEDESVYNLMDEFHKTVCEYKAEIDKINALYEKMDKVVDQKLIKIHDKFDPVLNSLTEQLYKLGFDVSEITADESNSSNLSDGEYPVKVRKIKVRVVKKKFL